MDMECDNLLLQAIPHAFLPKKTPAEEQPGLGEIEQFLLHSVHQSLSQAIQDSVLTDKMQEVLNMFEMWALLQPNPNPLELNEEPEFVENFLRLVSNLSASSTIPIYIREQNCTILMEQQDDGQLQVETFRAALPSQLVMSSFVPLFMNFPETRDMIQNRELFSSPVFAKSLYQLATKEIGISGAIIVKNNQAHPNKRDVANPFLISDWLVTVLSPTGKVKSSQEQRKEFRIPKKIRDQVTLIPVRMSSNLLPFRRSGMWLSIKVALQLKLLKLFSDDAYAPKFVYKLLMLRALADICKMYYDMKEDLRIDLDLAAQMMAKVGNRVRKLQELPHFESKNEDLIDFLNLEVLRVQVLEHVEGIVSNMHQLMKMYLGMSMTEDGSNEDQAHALPSRSQKKYLNDLNHSISFLSNFQELHNSTTNSQGSAPEVNITEHMQASLELQRYVTLDSMLAGQNSLTRHHTLRERIWLHDTETFMKTQKLEMEPHSWKIRQLVQTYVKHGLTLYKGNPIGISQMILVVLKAVEVLDKRATNTYPLLWEFSSGIDCKTFNCLLLPQKDDMKLLDELLSHFEKRNKSVKDSNGILSRDVTEHSFAVKFASQNSKMINLRENILRQTEDKIEQRLAEINLARIQCGEILQQISMGPPACSCTYTTTEKKTKRKITYVTKLRTFHCDKCKLEDKVAKMRTQFPLFERPLPKAEVLQKAVIFEVIIPKLISDLRDCLAILNFNLLEKPVFDDNEVSVKWIEYKNLINYLPQGPQEVGGVIALGSKCLNISSTCYRNNRPDILTCTDEQLVVDNGLQCTYSYQFTEKVNCSGLGMGKRRRKNGKKLIKTNPIMPLTLLKNECSFQIDGMENSKSYLPLQKYLQSYSHSQNDVIANQASCHENLSLDEFLSFGSIRAGHRIQLRNLYRAIASKVLSLEEEAVLALVLQTIWEVGPCDEDMNNRESYLDFEDDEFCSGILEVLEALVNANKTNYNHPLKLMAAVVITVRILELNDNMFQRCHSLLGTWRMVMRRWTRAIELKMPKARDNPCILTGLRKTLLLIRICSAFSYNVSKSIKWDKMMTRHEDIVEWYHTIFSLNQNEKDSPLFTGHLSKFMQTLLSIGRNVALQLELEADVMNQPILLESLHMFATDKWAKAVEFHRPESKFVSRTGKNLIQLTFFEKMKRPTEDDVLWIAFDFILGAFFVNGFPEGQLPPTVTSLPIFLRFFRHNADLRVQKESPVAFTTIEKFQGKHYEFIVSEILPNGDPNDNLIDVVIKEISDDGTALTLLQNENFFKVFSPTLVEGYTHWFDPINRILYFRRIPTQYADDELSHEYKLVKETSLGNWQWRLLDVRNDLAMLNINSKGFKNVAHALERLELSQHINVVIDRKTKVVSAHLPRFNLRFIVNQDGSMESVEFPGFVLIKKGKLKTLIGLQNGIQLKSKSKQVLLVPNGSIHAEGVNQIDTQCYHHQTFVNLKELKQPSYFVYEFDQVLNRLVANKSKQAWLYLAALNAVTSSVLPDPFTGVTGTEMALRILQSGFIWSSGPYDEDSLRILEFIKSLAPKRKYYGHRFLRESQKEKNQEEKEDEEKDPKHKETRIGGSIEAIEWPVGLPSMAAYDGYEIIVEKLIEDSERLGPLYYLDKEERSHKSALVKDEDDPELSTILRLRSYFRHLNTYNQGVAVKRNYFKTSILTDKLQLETKKVSVNPVNADSFNLFSAAHTASCRLPDSFRAKSPLFHKTNDNINLLHFLFSEYKPYYDGSPNSLKDIFNLDFRTSWFSIYGLAVKPHKSPGEQHHFTMLLCALAYKNKDVPIEQFINLHYISAFADEVDFPQQVQFPSHSGRQLSLVEPSNFEVDTTFCNILFKNVDQQKVYDEMGLSPDVYKTVFGDHLASIAIYLRSRTWPHTYSLGAIQRRTRTSLTDLYINVELAIREINDFLYQLYWWGKLKEFATDVQNRLDRIHGFLTSNPKQEAKAFDKSVKSFGLVQLGEVEWKREVQLGEALDRAQLNKKLWKEAEKYFRTGNVAISKSNVGLQLTDPEITSALTLREIEYYEKANKIMQNLMLMRNDGTERKILHLTGLQPRKDPTSLLKCLAQNSELGNRNEGECEKIVRTYAGALAVLWVHIKRLNRCLAYHEGGQDQEFQREMENVGHENWDQQARPEWLLLELELDIMIRRIQIKVAEQMMKMPDGGNGVMQMNMGEGKTSVIVPMLCCILGKRDALCRVTVLSSMFNMNYGILSFAIGGLLNRRVYTIPCRRDMEIDEECADGIQNVYRECLGVRGVLLTLPEYRLSFRLLAYDNILKGDVPLGMKLLKTENWLRLHARDILDESDELLNAKYQLVYTVGEQISLDGGELRWTTCQKLLKIVQEVGKDFLEKYGEECVEFNKEEGNQNPHQFTPFRLLDHSTFPQFVSTVADRFIDGIIVSADEKLRIKQLLTQEKIKKSRLEESLKMVKDLPDLLNTILIMSGYLRRGVLTLGLSKRWRVEYGVDASKSFRRMAVPFRAKDVPAERTEFGHPDLAILLTHLSYYYSGLSDLQLEETIKLLGTKQGSEAIYGSWIQQIPDMQVPKNLSNLHGLNLKDARQRSRLFGLLRRHKAVVDFWLSHKVFPRESKQFPAKLVMTSWDLCYERQVHPVTGFSGTNDSSVLLPLAIAQQDLPSLVGTNKEVEGMLLQRENQGHRNLEMGAKCIDILKMMKEDNLTVLIDAGALMLEYNNEEVANKWLQLDKELEAVLYFSSTNELVVMCRTGPGQINGCIVPFELSSFQDRLDKCGIFLDDQHTRGTDLKFPVGTRGCVTVGGKMKRDKLIQACMRMRKLGRGHSVTFYLSHEAYDKIRNVERVQTGKKLTTSDVLEWARANTQSYNEDGLLYWAIAGKNYAQRLAAEDSFYFPSSFKHFQMDGDERRGAELLMKGKVDILTSQCMDLEVTTLMELYGSHIQPDLIVKYISNWIDAAWHNLKLKNNNNKLPTSIRENFEKIQNRIIERCVKHIPERMHLSMSNMEEEQEKELELEKEMEEEIKIERRRKVKPAKDYLHPNVIQVVVLGEPAQLKEGIMRLCDAFRDTTFWGEVQPEGWGNEVFATTDFISIVGDKYVKTDLFIRPIEYVISLERKSGMRQMLVLSPFEVNELMPMFRDGKVASGTCLHMFSLRRSEKQNLLLNESRLMLPRRGLPHIIPEGSSFIAALLLASGNLYFDSMEEQKGFANFLRLAPRPWTIEEEKAFERGLITKTGFVMTQPRGGGDLGSTFRNDPSELLRMILACRHPVLSDMAHVVKLLNERCYIRIGK